MAGVRMASHFKQDKKVTAAGGGGIRGKMMTINGKVKANEKQNV